MVQKLESLDSVMDFIRDVQQDPVFSDPMKTVPQPGQMQQQSVPGRFIRPMPTSRLSRIRSTR